MSGGWRDVWDFDDLDLSESRFRALLDRDGTAHDRAGVLTQLARIEGLRGRFPEGELLLAQGAAEIGDDDKPIKKKIPLGG